MCVCREAGDRVASSKRTQGDLRRLHHVFQDLMKISAIITLDVITYDIDAISDVITSYVIN